VNRLKRLIVLLALAFVVALVPALPARAKKPLRGTMELFFTGPANPVWTGTISGDINGDMYFHNTGSKDVGQAHHFWEIWEIWDGDDLLLRGIDEGVVSWKNSKYRMNGEVTEASPEWENLIGRKVHMNGSITFVDGVPATAPGTFRVARARNDWKQQN